MQVVIGNIVDTKLSFLIHGCNAQGVMGSGVAKAVRDKWPQAYSEYKSFIDNTSKPLGRCSIVVEDGITIGNLITQEYYGNDGKIYANAVLIKEAILDYLKEIKTLYGKHDNILIATPIIGCGLGGLNWDIDVKPILEQIEHDESVEFVVYKL